MESEKKVLIWLEGLFFYDVHLSGDLDLPDAS